MSASIDTFLNEVIRGACSTNTPDICPSAQMIPSTG